MELEKNNSNFINDLCNLMENKKFRNFYNKYFTFWVNINTTIMYFKLYEIINISFSKKFNRPIKKNEMSFILHNIIKNNILRNIVINNYELFKNSHESYLLTNINYLQ